MSTKLLATVGLMFIGAFLNPLGSASTTPKASSELDPGCFLGSSGGSEAEIGVTLLATAYEPLDDVEEEVIDIKISVTNPIFPGNNPNNVCSTANGGGAPPAGVNCSVKLPVKPPTTTAQAAACSVNSSTGGNQTGTMCSTIGTVPAQSNGSCSAQGPSPPVAGFPTICSAQGPSTAPPFGQTRCSVIPQNPSTITCSTMGGSSGNNNGGNAACSAGGNPPIPGNPGGMTCSVFGTNPSNQGNCSTNSGQHQVCSSGGTEPGDISVCSSKTDAGMQSQCSVAEPPPAPGPGGNPVYGNKCSAFFGDANVPGNGGGAQLCSVFGTTGTCSVRPNQTNTVCTILPFGNPVDPQGPVVCSAYNSQFPPQPVNNNPVRCSVIGQTGPVIKPGWPHPYCGTGVHSHPPPTPRVTPPGSDPSGGNGGGGGTGGGTGGGPTVMISPKPQVLASAAGLAVFFLLVVVVKMD